MENLYTYVPAFFAHWLPILAGGVLGGAVEAFSWLPRMKEHIEKISVKYFHLVAVVSLLSGVFFAGFQVWQDEHSARITAEHTDQTNRPAFLTDRETFQEAPNSGIPTTDVIPSSAS